MVKNIKEIEPGRYGRLLADITKILISEIFTSTDLEEQLLNQTILGSLYLQ